MASGEEISKAIDKIYDTALDTAQWTDLLRTIGGVVGAPQGSLMVGSACEKTFTDFGYGRNEEAIALYNTRFIREDPWFEPLARLGVGAVATGQELCPTKQFKRTAYYNECLKLDEVYDCLGVILEGGRDLNAFIAFQRPEFLPLFGATEKKTLRTLVPHLRRIIQLHRVVDGNSAMLALQADILNRLSFGVIILTRADGVQFVNRTAREIANASDGLSFTSKGLVADYAKDNDGLAEAQQKSLLRSSKGSTGPRGSTVSVRRPSMKRPYTVQVMPLNDQVLASARMLGGNDPAALIVITDPCATRTPAIEVLVQAYRLTPAEAALALQVGKGYSLKDASDYLAISIETARWHLKNVLAKTETARQSELIGLLATITSPLTPPV